MRVCAGLRERLFTVNKILLDGAAESLARNLGERSDKWTMWGQKLFLRVDFLIMYVYVYKYTIMISE